MCMVDDCDGWVEMIAATRPKARKEHKCAECYRIISAGETYIRERFKFDGEITNHRTCAHCGIARGWLQAECGGYAFGAIEEDIAEHVGNGGYGLGVGRLVVGMRHHWRRRNGALLPLPRTPKTTHERMRP